MKETVHILDLPEELEKLRGFLKRMSEDAAGLMAGESPFRNAFLETDQWDRVVAEIPAEEKQRLMQK